MRRIVAGLFALAGGCAGDAGTATGPRTWDGDFLIDQITIDCTDFTWTYEVITQGWGDTITVDVVAREFGALVWRETHALPEVEYGEGWARHRVELDLAFTDADQQDDVSTLFACDAKLYLTYGFAAWRLDGDLQECVAWGVDPTGEFPDCANWGEAHGAP